ncbi:divergent polysaccharide deacetylase family protein [Geobacter sp. AOG2]|uniref:divergent polysaccharide deacetylase family protein n=1 Tax=Geobacter sp. AOG2 TaxID=1566347 RepID=UPI001CC427E9|nr:divergent polysaccharide deacetylase family protein [Geobacter sp. AOG2]GFE61601.1 hypothetical protein AOG2_21880 [Geobacter sp. AOG2]
MTKPRNKRYKQRSGGGSRIAAVALLATILLAVGLYFIMSPRGNPPSPPQPSRNAANLSPTPIPEAGRPASPVAPQPGVSVTGEAQYPHETTSKEEDNKPAISPAGVQGKLAIIIDDMGSTLQEARALAGIGLPLTFSIIPGLHSDRDVAGFAARSGIETMIHIPMQSKGWPQRRLEANGLLTSMDDAAIREHLGEYTREIPTAIGVNNHMGSEFTEHEDKMRVVLEELKGKGLFFIDSVTTPRTVGARLAREMGVKTAKRNVFLDNEQNGAYIRGQLAQAVRMAKKNGTAIAICHPHPATIATLVETLPALAGQGITLVPVSQLVR